MSFSHETKLGLVELSNTSKHDCCKRASLYGMLISAGIFTREKCKLVTTVPEFAEFVIKQLHSLYSVEGNLYITDRKSGEEDERRVTKITVPQKKEVERLLVGFKYPPESKVTDINHEMFKCQNCRAAFVRGVFLSSGTVTNPDKSYHLEMSLQSSELAENLSALLCETGLEPKFMQRKNENVLYYKDSENIENFLAYIGANTAAFTIMNKKIERELRSEANRLANGELANLGKTVAAAGDQIAAINALKASGELSKMPEELQVTAMLRLEHYDATLSELAALHDPPITKSGVNHRLKKLSAAYSEMNK